MVLREEPICRRCPALATEVDHVIPREEGGDDTRENLQALCKPCHSAKTAKEDRGFGGAARSPSGVAVTLVVGAPGAGKSRWTSERAKWGDLIIDLDEIYAALSGLPLYDKPEALLPFVAEARDAIVNRLSRPSQLARAWIVATMPKRLEREVLRRRLGARVVVLEVSASECIRRIESDKRRTERASLWREHVERWWTDYERDERDVVVRA